MIRKLGQQHAVRVVILQEHSALTPDNRYCRNNEGRGLMVRFSRDSDRKGNPGKEVIIKSKKAPITPITTFCCVFFGLLHHKLWHLLKSALINNAN
jgi:hypothetical protein